MRYIALATDYDGTLARDSRVSAEARQALARLRASGRRLILITGRQLDDLLSVFPQVELFDRVVAENGAILYCPATHDLEVLAEAPPGAFLDALQMHGVQPLLRGRVIVATVRPQEKPVLEVIAQLGLELQVIFNRDAMMVLPSGTNKATGLDAALSDLRLSAHNVVGIGDAENDQAFLARCECAVGVADAIATLRERADHVTRGPGPAGVIETVEALLANDLADLEAPRSRHQVLLGTQPDGVPVTVNGLGTTVLLVGPSGTGKSAVATALLEGLAEHGYQLCVIDPEGDYETFAQAAVLGNPERAATVSEVLRLLDSPQINAVVTMLGLRLEDRPAFIAGLLPRLQEMRAHVGRPHWIVIDEAHHWLPSTRDPAGLPLPREMGGLLLITVHPERLSPAVLSTMDMAVMVGSTVRETMAALSQALGRPAPQEVQPPAPGEALAWLRNGKGEAFHFTTAPRRSGHRRQCA